MPVVDRGDVRIWWEAEGEGEPILLIMGLGYSSDMWWRLLPELTRSYRTIRFDNRGVGRTGVPAGPYPLTTMADDALAVLDAAGEASAHVLGVSMGGFIAQEVALRAPERLRSLILGCTATGGAEMVPAEPAAMEMAAARASLPPEEAAEVAIPFVYAKGTPRSVIDEDFAVRMQVPTTPEGYANQLRGVQAWTGGAARLRAIAVPTLILQGNEDRLVNPANAPVLAAAIEGAQMEVLEGASHIFFSDQPAASAKAITSFLETQSAPR
ncbi:MAG TPA: alpha/beta fold hydrolase [Acidimicrobiales bacterium]|nr:alpha/beta fold hydrolase [Acidimicrobiales bacterium]